MITALTTTPYSPALQAAVDAALAAFPADAVFIHRGAAIVQKGEIREPANGKGWLIGLHGWEVGCGTCLCQSHTISKVPRCKHMYAQWLYRKAQQMPAPRSLTYYGDWQGVAGVITIYEWGDVQATFQPHTGMFPVAIPLERWHEVVLGGRKEMVDATYPRD